MKINDIIKEINIDNKQGWGSTGNNRNVDYMGVIVYMKPSIFLKLSLPLHDDDYSKANIENMVKHHEQNGTFASPMLYLNFPKQWYDNKVDRGIGEVVGHEGRHRMNVQLKVEGDIPLETHLFVSGYRAKNWQKNNETDYTPEILAKIRMKLKSEHGTIVNGPLFELE